MNIIEAGKALADGKYVRRKSWRNPDARVSCVAAHQFSESDLLADDWEIFDNRSPMDKAWEEYIAKFNYDDSPSEQDIKENFFKAGFNAALNHLIKK